ncbi:TBC1 domain family member 31 [Bagarius yarrelli]|uniref:TBC1 domain family member 31 n=1 Tax=Bagarius yarrelli TaxID=175774 RepID=A0A556U180_BAGYA|nr:TBC1 domain family member 31 [Bagarius yarrelli]
MQTLQIANKECGKLWHRKPAPSNNGVLLTIIRSAAGYQSKTVRFLQVAFDTTGEAFLAGDHHGNIYMFDISRNRFKLVQKTGQACTALAFNLRRTTEYLIALSDYSIKCYDTETKQLVSWMRGHEGAVSSLSVHGSGRYAISTSSDTAQLWDCDTFQRKRKLNVRHSVGIQKVFFLPLGNTILSCFTDDSIFAWESETLFCKYQLPVPQDGPQIHYKAFAVTQDGKTLAAAGRSNLIHLWSLDSRELLRILQMPQEVRTVRHLVFLPDSFDRGSSQILGVLSQDGLMRFINIQTCKQLFEIGSHDDAINSAAICPKGRHVLAVMDCGAVRVYSVQALTQEINKPPQSLVKTVTAGKKANTSCLKMKVHSGATLRPAKTAARRVRTKTLRPPDVSTLENKENDLPGGLNKKRLQFLLRTHGEYPAKYRMFIWRSLLQLPENHAVFSSLTDKGLHSAYVCLQERYPIKSQKLQRGLQRILSALAHWSAIFGEAECLPLLAFPFAKLFQNNPLVCFEVVATVIVNWCQHWFEYFPNPPLNILSMVENVLAHHDKELLGHFVNCGVTSQLYVWPLLQTLFSEVLTRDEWLKLFDNVFSNHPSFLLMAVVAYVTCCRAPLLLCIHRDDFEYFFHHRNNVDMSAMLKEAYRLMEITPADLHPSSMLNDFEPLTPGQYPIFNKYPTFIVEYQQALQELRAEAVRQRAEDEAWYTQQELLQQAEEQRRQILQEEENKLAHQRTRMRFLKHQQDQRKMELRRLDDEIQRKMALREQETALAVQDMEVRQMELDAQRRLLEQQLAKKHESVSKEVRAEVDAWRQRVEMGDSVFLNLHQTDTDLSQDTRKVLEESLAEAGRLDADTEWQTEVIKRLKRAEEEQEMQRQQLSNLSCETHAKEERLVQMMMEAESNQWNDVVAKQAMLAEERQVTATADALQNSFLSQQRHEITQHHNTLRRSQKESLNLQRERRRRSPQSTKESSSPQDTNTVHLNNQSLSDNSTCFSLERGQGKLDHEERQLLQEVRDLRKKLAARARTADYTLYSTSSHQSQ